MIIKRISDIIPQEVSIMKKKILIILSLIIVAILSYLIYMIFKTNPDFKPYKQNIETVNIPIKSDIYDANSIKSELQEIIKTKGLEMELTEINYYINETKNGSAIYSFLKIDGSNTIKMKFTIDISEKSILEVTETEGDSKRVTGYEKKIENLENINVKSYIDNNSCQIHIDSTGINVNKK